MTARTKYTICGALFGACFPVVGTLVYAWTHLGSLSLAALGRSQIDSPLLWIIDTAPIWLGFFASGVGQREDALRRLICEREATIARRTEDLERALEEAEAASRAKGRFLANMSHEIRTPMTAILGFAEMLQEPEFDAARRAEAVQIIYSNGQHLLEVINDILDYSKIEAGKMPIEAIPCSPRALVGEVASLMAIHAAHKDLDFRTTCAGPLPETITSDPTRIRQILLNLVGNAIKFTERGAVELKACLAEDRAGPAIAFSVRDTGIGMTPEQMACLFQSFSQADDSTSRKHGGTGLGLAVCKRLVDLMDGACSVESAPGGGSTFTVVLPAGDLAGVSLTEAPAGGKVKPAAAAPSAAPADLAGCRVLLAEDNAVNARLIRAILEKLGASVEVAVNGRLAVECCLAGEPDGHAFDIVLMDIQMPEMDGYEATRRLRAAGWQRPILALTANAMATDRQRCLDAGCDGCATKPVVRAELAAQIRRLTRQSTRPDAHVPA